MNAVCTQESLPPGGGVGETRARPQSNRWGGGTELARSSVRRFRPRSSRWGVYAAFRECRSAVRGFCVLETLCVPGGCFLFAVDATTAGRCDVGRGFIGEAMRSRTGACYSPHSRLGWRGTQTTPGCRPGLPWAAATQLYKDGPQVASRRVTHVNRSIRSSPRTHNTARGNVLVHVENAPGRSPGEPSGNVA